jgi:hypothetical protein
VKRANGLKYGKESKSYMEIKTLEATRYITPLKEGGSLPAVVEGSDSALYVLKFRGAGQGPKALVAELLGGEIARALGLPVPELVLMYLDESLGRNEGDPEIQDLIKASVGLNLALKYLEGALAYDPAASPKPDHDIASRIVWLDAYLTNVDRTVRNTNMLLWQRQLWLIDHAASLYFHFNWNGYQEKAASRFPAIRQHVLLPRASKLEEANRRSREKLDTGILQEIVGLVPDEWLDETGIFASREENRQAYLTYLSRRLDVSEGFVEEAINARTGSI